VFLLLQIYSELAGLSELRFHWRDKLPPYSVTTSLAGAMAHYPDRDLLLALYHVPQVPTSGPAAVASSSHDRCTGFYLNRTFVWTYSRSAC
jgi:hypothetical protein